MHGTLRHRTVLHCTALYKFPPDLGFYFFEEICVYSRKVYWGCNTFMIVTRWFPSLLENHTNIGEILLKGRDCFNDSVVTF